MSNRTFYSQSLARFKKEGCKYPDAAALAELVEHCIKEKSYKVYNRESDEQIDFFDVIVTFNFAGDPTFGLLRDNDGSPVITFSTPDGLMSKYL